MANPIESPIASPIALRPQSIRISLSDLHTRNLIACRSFSVHFLFFSFADADLPPADTSRSLGFESPLLTTFYGTGRIPRVFSSTAQYALLRSVPLENEILVEFLNLKRFS